MQAVLPPDLLLNECLPQALTFPPPHPALLQQQAQHLREQQALQGNQHLQVPSSC